MMRSRLLATTLVLAATAFSLPAAAQGPDPEDREPVGRAMLFWALDRNGDGAIDQSELQAARGALFDALDADKNGTLTREEVLAGLPRMGHGPHGWGGPGMGRGPGMERGMMGPEDGPGGPMGPDGPGPDGRGPGWGGPDGGPAAEGDRDARREERRARRDERRERMEDRREKMEERLLARLGFGEGDSITRADFIARPTPAFTRLDTNEDGKVSRAEFMVAGPHVLGFLGPLAR